MRAINLKTEYLKNPVGIDIRNLRLFWNCEDGIKQTAYQIIASVDNEIILDTGKVASSQMTGIPFGENVNSKTRVYWKVKLWDENDVEGNWSDTAFFETAFLNPAEWKAKWICGNYKVNKKERYPVDCFKKTFSVKKEVKSARLYATACGLYEISLNNGNSVNMPLAPGITDYRKRVQYQTYDVTELIKKGENVITAMLSDGWYRGSCGAWGLKNQYGTETKLLAQLEIKYTDGSQDTVVTDSSWLWSNDGPITFADIQDGEIIQAEKAPSYSKNAKVTSHDVVPSCSNNVPIAEMETFKGKIHKSPKGKRIIDFGQNLAGYVSFAVSAKKGQKITMRFGELIGEDGELTLKNIQCSSKKKTTPLQKIEYYCKDGVNTYKTKFAIFGFRYVEIDTDIDVNEEDFTAIAVYSKMEETGFFDSSNELLNKFVTATKWSTKSNSTDLPTDCPTRERHGWLGDAQIFCNTASYLFDYIAFAKKYENDICDAQHKNGNYTQIVPVGGVDFYMNAMDGSAGWSDAGIFIPYRLYKKYGDIQLLKDKYESMRKFAEYKIKTLGKWYLTSLPTGVGLKHFKNISNYGQSYGEWAEPKDVKAFEISDFICPHPEETTAYIVYMLQCMAEIAKLLGKESDEKRFLKYAESAKLGYQKLVSTKKYTLDTDRQAKLVRPLYFDLLDGKQKEFAEKRLIKALDNYGWRLGTGFLSTPLILYVLEKIDKEYAYRLLENEKMPGWLFMTKSGATTIWESWEGTEAQGGIASLNHYSKGAVCEWIFKVMCGIQVDGENHFAIKPLPGGHFTYANARYKSIYGEVYSGWKKENGKYLYDIKIPANTTAEIILPNNTVKTVTAGSYTFEC